MFQKLIHVFFKHGLLLLNSDNPLNYITQINWNSLKILDYFQYPPEGYKYLHENIFVKVLIVETE